MKEPWTLGMLTAAIILIALAGWRWHEAVAASPDRIPGVEGPSLLLLVGGGDCPDRRAAMMQWVRSVGRTEDPLALPMAVGVLPSRGGGVDPGLDMELAGTPRLDPHGTSRATRAALRAGLEGTPALLLLDDRGRVLLADAFTERGPGPRFALAAGLLAAVASGVNPTHPNGR
jgi:hypothetical protein